jgi:hypothetical protein
VGSSLIWALPGREKKSLAAARKTDNTGARQCPRNDYDLLLLETYTNQI